MRAQAVRPGLLALCVSCALTCRAAGSTTFAVYDLYNLVQIESGEGHYALWAYVQGSYAFVGQFNSDTDEQHMRDPNTGDRFSSFTTDADLTAAALLLVTVEPGNSTHATPSTHHLMAGDVISGAALMNPSHPAALGLEYSSASGNFVLDTPTTPAETDFSSGVWFLNPGLVDGPGLQLPLLPSGWIYESWVADAGSTDPIPMSMGEFADPTTPDINGAGGGAGTGQAPGFPGQDFIYTYEDQPVMPNLAKGEWTLVISIEPSPNTGPSPFHSLEPLIVSAVQKTARREPQTLGNNSNVFPSMTVKITDSTPVTASTWGQIKSLYHR